MKDYDTPPPPPDYDPVSEEPKSPMLAAINMSLTSWTEGKARIHGPIMPPIVNRSGLVHGGALMTLLDAAAGYAGCWCPYPGRVRRAVTLSMTTNFLKAGRTGFLHTEGLLTRGGRSIFFATAVVRDDAGKEVASGTGVFKYMDGSDKLYGVERQEEA